MPLYNMRCPECGHAKEYLMKGPAERVCCPSCETTLERGDLGKPGIGSGKNGSSKREKSSCNCPGCHLENIALGVDISDGKIKAGFAQYSCGEVVPIIRPSISSEKTERDYSMN